MTSPMMCIALLFLSRGVPLSSIRSQQDQGDQCMEVDSLGFDQMMMSNSSTLLRQLHESRRLPQWLSSLKQGFDSLADSLAGSANKFSASVESSVVVLRIQHWLKVIQANIKTAEALAEQVQELQALGFNDERWENAHIEIQNALKAHRAFSEVQETLMKSKVKKQLAKEALQQARKKAQEAKNNVDQNMQLTNEEIKKHDPLDEFAAAFFAERAEHEEMEKKTMQEMMKIKESLQKSIIEVQGLYSDAQVTISQQQQQLASYELQDGMQFDSGVHNNITQAQLQLAAMQSNGPLGNKVMESFARNALCNTNSMIHRSSGKTQLQCFKACAEETHCNYFAEWNHSEVGDDTSCDCLLYSSCEDYEIIDNHTENVTNQSMLWHVQSASEQTGVLATQLALQIQLEDANLKLKDANLYLAEEMSKVEEEVDELQEESFFWKVGLAAAALLCVCTASGWALYARKDCKRRFCRHSGFEEGAEPEVVNNPGIVNITVHTPDCDGQTAVVGRPVFLPGQPGKKQDVASGYAGPSIGGHMEPDTQKRRLSDLKAELHQQRRQSLRSSDRESEAESWQHSRRSSRRSSGQSEAELWQQKKRSLRSSGSASQDRRRSRDTQDSSRRASSQFLATWEEQFTGMDLGINLQEEDSDTEGSSESSGDEAQRYTRRPSSLAAERRPSSTQQSLRRPSSAEGSSRRPSSTPGRSSKRTPQPRTKTSADAERQQRGSKSSAASARRSLPDEQLNIGNSRRRSHSSSEGQASLSKAPKRPQRSSLPVRAREPRHSGVSSATASSASSIDPRLSRY
mmetsp:Transcript_59796/g.104576  ORF Transcript_59796/g.104576 Transcript_59796/m.104576 type:complete len:800 (+) Transcript_59796:46-2445(+)